jgi:hypothetical protein
MEGEHIPPSKGSVLPPLALVRERDMVAGMHCTARTPSSRAGTRRSTGGGDGVERKHGGEPEQLRDENERSGNRGRQRREDNRRKRRSENGWEKKKASARRVEAVFQLRACHIGNYDQWKSDCDGSMLKNSR